MSILDVASIASLGRSGKTIKFVGEANLWIDESYCSKTIDLAKELILTAYQKTAPGQLEVIVYDKNLTGIAAPFAALQSNSSQLLKILSLEDELTDYLDFLKLHIQGVNNVLQGKFDNLAEFRASIKQPVEGYKLIVLAVDLYGLDDKTKEDLSILLNAGPAVGVNFLVISTTISADPYLMDKCTVLKPEDYPCMVTSSDITSFCQSHLKHLAQTAIAPIHFSEIQTHNNRWTQKSTNGITFAVGKHGTSTVEIRLGDEKDQRHNALITGAVGQGKSNLLSVIIHSLCQRYSPKELELYLLDFKEGVTLQGFSNIRHEHYLPHAKALGLESDVDFGIAVLEHLFAEYETRMQLFKAAGTQNIKQYRTETGEVIPRIVLMIDEFQVLFEERQSAKISAALLSKCSRLFRAAGIHILLASQTIASGIELSKDSDIFAQTPIRIAHKNSVRESEATLGLGNSAASDLRMGQAIINLDYGALSLNKKVTIALADSRELLKIQEDWWHSAKGYTRPPYVFEGGKAARISSVLNELKALRTVGAGAPRVFLGETISVTGAPLEVSLAHETGRNIAIIGAGTKVRPGDPPHKAYNTAVGIIQAAALSLALQNPQGNAHFVALNALDEASAKNNNMRLFITTMQNLGFLVEEVNKNNFETRLDELAKSLDGRSTNDDAIYLLGFALDKVASLPKSFQQICREGSVRSVHVLAWWQKGSRFSDHIGFGNEAYFDVKALLRLDAREVQRIVGIYDSWENKDNRLLVTDSAYLEQAVTVLPYAPIDSHDAREIAKEIQ